MSLESTSITKLTSTTKIPCKINNVIFFPLVNMTHEHTIFLFAEKQKQSPPSHNIDIPLTLFLFILLHRKRKQTNSYLRLARLCSTTKALASKGKIPRIYGNNFGNNHHVLGIEFSLLPWTPPAFCLLYQSSCNEAWKGK